MVAIFKWKITDVSESLCAAGGRADGATAVGMARRIHDRQQDPAVQSRTDTQKRCKQGLKTPAQTFPAA